MPLPQQIHLKNGNPGYQGKPSAGFSWYSPFLFIDKYKSSKMKALRSFAKGLENDKTDNRRRTSNIRVIVKKIINMHHDGCCVLGFTVVSGE